jgi:hypothetical protein
VHETIHELRSDSGGVPTMFEEQTLEFEFYMGLDGFAFDEEIVDACERTAVNHRNFYYS